MLKRMMIPKPVTSIPSSYHSCTCVEALLDPPLFPTPLPTTIPPPIPPHSNPFHKFSWKGKLGMRAKVACDNKSPVSCFFVNLI